MKFFLLTLMLGLLGACASKDHKRQYCESLDTYKKGYTDGAKGLPSHFFDSYRQECETYVDILKKEEGYERGWKQAISSFCTEKNGYELGLKAKKYHNVCPKNIESEFLAGYKNGDRKCLYEEGYNFAMSGKEEAFSESSCKKLEGELSEREYKTGHKAGLKVFCGYEHAYKLGLKGSSYQVICSKKTKFFKGYRAGDRKCLYKAGFNHALEDKPSSYDQSTCSKSEGKLSEKQYKKGRRAGLKVFCGYEHAYKLGLKGSSYQIICSKKTKFFKGYRAGDRKCLYKVGFNHAVKGMSSAFEESKCKKLKGNKKSYQSGRVSGLKVFCTYKNGFNYGLKGYQYNNICPKNLEENFFKAYSLGYQEYRAEKRKEEILSVERERIRAEERDRQEALALERERIEVERERVEAERERVEAEEKSRSEALKLSKERMEADERARRLKGYRLCALNSDCGKGYECSYNFKVEERVCVRK